MARNPERQREATRRYYEKKKKTGLKSKRIWMSDEDVATMGEIAKLLDKPLEDTLHYLLSEKFLTPVMFKGLK
ncbi:MAG: hypothetical protein KAI83_20305 [Thiomargarita sp.]|nr:hypothetical protein [Thiomargarita sp.]